MNEWIRPLIRAGLGEGKRTRSRRRRPSPPFAAATAADARRFRLPQPTRADARLRRPVPTHVDAGRPQSAPTTMSASGSTSGAARESTSIARSGGGWPVSPIPPHLVPVIECPWHADSKLVLLTADTDRNRGRKFFRCMKNARMPNACTFFKWEDEYYKYLVDNGFMDPYFQEIAPAAVERRLQPVDEAGLQNVVHELQGKVVKMEADIDELKRVVNRRGQQNGDLISILVALNVLVQSTTKIANSFNMT
ncbi:hypothetical protein EJB05_24456, partial [Eragrostis curvula]